MEALKQIVADLGVQYPWLVFVALVILPGVGFPASALLLLAGAVWGSNAGSCLAAVGAVMLNVVWTHAVAAGPGRAGIVRLLGERWKRWENLPRTDLLRVACILRVTPGVPLFAQNYILGLLGVPLRLSLLIALPLTGLSVCGFVLTGGALFQGQSGMALTGICLLATAAMATRLIRGKQAIPRKGPDPARL